MSILCKCPTCGNTYTFPELHAGKHVSCSGCQSVFAIPTPVIDLAPAPVSAASLAVVDDLGLDSLPSSTSVPRTVARPGKSRPRAGQNSKFKLSQLDNQTLVIGSAGGAGLLLIVLVLAMVFMRSGGPKPDAPVLTALAVPAAPPASIPVAFPAANSPVASVPPPAGFVPVVAPVEPAKTEPALTPPPTTDPAATPTVEKPPTTDPAASEPDVPPAGKAPPAAAPAVPRKLRQPPPRPMTTALLLAKRLIRPRTRRPSVTSRRLCRSIRPRASSISPTKGR